MIKRNNHRKIALQLWTWMMRSLNNNNFIITAHVVVGGGEKHKQDVLVEYHAIAGVIMGHRVKNEDKDCQRCQSLKVFGPRSMQAKYINTESKLQTRLNYEDWRKDRQTDLVDKDVKCRSLPKCTRKATMFTRERLFFFKTVLFCFKDEVNSFYQSKCT